MVHLFLVAYTYNNRVLRLPAIVFSVNKNDCWKTKNSVVECEASENVCEKLTHTFLFDFGSQKLDIYLI